LKASSRDSSDGGAVFVPAMWFVSSSGPDKPLGPDGGDATAAAV
jgi:hypothetical protein